MKSVAFFICGLFLAGCPPLRADGVELLGTPASVELACGSAAVDVGEEGWRWALLEGFHDLERDAEGPTFAWTGRSAAVAVILSGAGAARVRVRLQPAPGITSVAASWDGRPLGKEPLEPGWQEVAWNLPRSAGGSGVHRLELAVGRTRSVPPDPRELGVRIDRVTTDQAGPSGCSEGADRSPSGPAVPVTLEPGEVLVLRVVPPPKPELLLLGSEGAPLMVDAVIGGFHQPRREVTLGGGSPAATSAPLDRCCEPDTLIALWPAEDGPVELRSVRLRGDPNGWRAACGQLPLEILLLLGYLGIAALAALAPPETTRSRTALDLVVVVGLALGIRALFLGAYPAPAASGDAWEYLTRSHLLASGQASFLHDTRWHAWQTWLRPPGYYLFLAGLRALWESWETVLPWAQGVLSALTAGGVYLMGLPLAGRRAALASGTLFALYPEIILTFSRILSEPLYMVLLVPGLAALARVSARPTGGWAAVAGVLFGLAAHVRSAPIFFVPVAAFLLLVVHGRRRGWKPAALLVLATVLTVAPWSVRNSRVVGHVMGMDDLAVVNLLQTSPDEAVVTTRGADLTTRGGFRQYYQRLQEANRDRALSRRSGEILRRGLVRLALHPGTTLRRFGDNLRDFAGLHPPASFGWSLEESRACRTWVLADLANGGYLLVLLIAVPGLPLALRRRAAWPVLAWLPFNAVVINLVFHPEIKYRLPLSPIVLLLAGIAVVRGVEWSRAAMARRRGLGA